MRDSAGATKADVRAQMRPSAMRGLGGRVNEMRHGQRNRRQGNATPWLTSASMEMPDELRPRDNKLEARATLMTSTRQQT
jgi:hypothetical protein